MATPDFVDQRTTSTVRGSPADVIAPAVLGAMALGAVLLYAVLWSSAITNDALLGKLPESPWLHAHVLFYLLGNALLVGTLALSVYFRVAATSTRVPWLEFAVLTISILFIAGVYTGFQFARPVWGYWPSDGKLFSAIAAAALAAVVVLPLSIWMRLRVQPNRRHLLLACCLLLVAALAALSFFYPARTIHPEGSLVPYS